MYYVPVVLQDAGVTELKKQLLGCLVVGLCKTSFVMVGQVCVCPHPSFTRRLRRHAPTLNPELRGTVDSFVTNRTIRVWSGRQTLLNEGQRSHFRGVRYGATILSC